MNKRMKPFTKRSDFDGRGGQMCIEVTCLYGEYLGVTIYTICGQPYNIDLGGYRNKKWFVGVENNNTSLDDSISFGDRGIGEGSRYNLHTLFPFSSQLLVKLQEFVDKEDYDGYLSFVSQSLSGEDKEKWDEYCDMRLSIEAVADLYDYPCSGKW